MDQRRLKAVERLERMAQLQHYIYGILFAQNTFLL